MDSLCQLCLSPNERMNIEWDGAESVPLTLCVLSCRSVCERCANRTRNLPAVYFSDYVTDIQGLSCKSTMAGEAVRFLHLGRRVASLPASHW